MVRSTLMRLVLAYVLMCVPAAMLYVGFNEGPLWLIPVAIATAVPILWFVQRVLGLGGRR